MGQISMRCAWGGRTTFMHCEPWFVWMLWNTEWLYSTLSEINHWMNVDISHQTDFSGKPTLKWLSRCKFMWKIHLFFTFLHWPALSENSDDTTRLASGIKFRWKFSASINRVKLGENTFCSRIWSVLLAWLINQKTPNPVTGSSLWLVKIGYSSTGVDFFIHKIMNRTVLQ